VLRKLFRTANRVALDRFGLGLVRREWLYPWQQRRAEGPGYVAGTLPPGAADILRMTNPRLQELERRYAAAPPAVRPGFEWAPGALTAEALAYFRGDNPYVFQRRGPNRHELGYALTYYATKADDREGLLDRLSEDELFGIHAFDIDGRMISRDLLDSVGEIAFLMRHAGLGTAARNVLDIGSGYGRLAHRIDQALDEVRVFATDAFAASTFLAEYYLRFRACERASAVPLDEVEALLASRSIDLAVNVHSFPECTPAAIGWWAELLSRHKVPRLFVVPNGEGEYTGGCRTNRGEEIEPILAAHGYRLALRSPRYRDPVVRRYGLDPVDFFLFELG